MVRLHTEVQACVSIHSIMLQARVIMELMTIVCAKEGPHQPMEHPTAPSLGVLHNCMMLEVVVHVYCNYKLTCMKASQSRVINQTHGLAKCGVLLPSECSLIRVYSASKTNNLDTWLLLSRCWYIPSAINTYLGIYH